MPTIRIPLHSRKHPGLFAIIDEEDYPLVSGYRWNVQPGRNTFYAITFVRLRGMMKSVQLKMHRVILDPPADLVVDHIDGNGLNNQRSNLHACTHQDNLSAANVHEPEAARGNTSGFRGVHFQKSRGKWTAHFKGKYIGIFESEIDAAIAYDDACLASGGNILRLNFPRRHVH